MLTLKKQLEGKKTGTSASPAPDRSSDRRVSVRDKLLVKEVQELEQNLPKTCKLRFDDPNKLHSFILTISPDEGHWRGGVFKFSVDVPDDYNILPPKVHCQTKIWHPNINEDGEVCLSLLRPTSIDGMGWAPTRRLKDIVWGLSSLFSDLLNFDDPLNVEAAEGFEKDKAEFYRKVQEYITKYATSKR